MAALARHIEQDPDIVVSGVIAPKADSPALAVAKGMGLRTLVVPYDESFAQDMEHALEESDWICLAGFMRLLPENVVDRWSGRILNIHPALLPRFGGKGMYGHHVHEAVLAAEEPESGCTVHLVTKEYDEGATVMQARCPVLPADTVESLSARVLELEHATYYKALKAAIHGKGY